VRLKAYLVEKIGLKIFEVRNMEKEQKVDVAFAFIIFLLFAVGSIVVFVIAVATSRHILIGVAIALAVIGFLVAMVFLKAKAKKETKIVTKKPREEVQIAQPRQPILQQTEEKQEKTKSLLNLDDEDEQEEEIGQETEEEIDETEAVEPTEQESYNRAREQFED
jgi:mannitol-specific phosphotransferase system IIBC component